MFVTVTTDPRRHAIMGPLNLEPDLAQIRQRLKG
jgi:hypothetical protein